MTQRLYSPANEIRDLVNSLVGKYYPHLRGLRLELVFRSKPIVAAGVKVAARVQKVTGLIAFVAREKGEEEARPFLVLEIDRDAWMAGARAWRVSLLDSRLCSVQADDEGKLTVVGSPSAEFPEVVRRRGAWNGRLREIVTAANEFDRARGRQRELGLEDEQPGAVA